MQFNFKSVPNEWLGAALDFNPALTGTILYVCNAI